MKTHNFGDEIWHEVPADQVDDWDKFHRYVAAYLLTHGIQKATALIGIEGQDWTLSIDLKRIPREQIN